MSNNKELKKEGFEAQTVTDCHGNQSTISLPKHLAMACQSLYPEIDKMLRSEGDWEAAKRAAHDLFNIVVEVAAWETGKSETHPFYGAVKWSPDHFNRGLSAALFNHVTAEVARCAVGLPMNPGINKWNPLYMESDGEGDTSATRSKRRRFYSSTSIKIERDLDAAMNPAHITPTRSRHPVETAAESSPLTEMTGETSAADAEEDDDVVLLRDG